MTTSVHGAMVHYRCPQQWCV